MTVLIPSKLWNATFWFCKWFSTRWNLVLDKVRGEGLKGDGRVRTVGNWLSTPIFLIIQITEIRFEIVYSASWARMGGKSKQNEKEWQAAWMKKKSPGAAFILQVNRSPKVKRIGKMQLIFLWCSELKTNVSLYQNMTFKDTFVIWAPRASQARGSKCSLLQETARLSQAHWGTSAPVASYCPVLLESLRVAGFFLEWSGVGRTLTHSRLIRSPRLCCSHRPAPSRDGCWALETQPIPTEVHWAQHTHCISNT